MLSDHQLSPALKQLRLSGILATLEARTRQAVDGHWSYSDFLARLLQDEVERRAQKQLDLRLRRSLLNTTKTLDTFDFSAAPTVNRQLVFELASCDFIRRHINLLLVGPSGTGKSHLACAFGHEAARQGFSVLFTNTHKMLQHLAGAHADGSTDKRMALYLRPDLLILDDFALKPLPASAREDLYDVIVERYEHRSIILTSNRAPDEWFDWLGDPLLASAAFDRLVHHAQKLVITGSSFRTRSQEEPMTTA
jgi:DNA replication protein DnaC